MKHPSSELDPQVLASIKDLPLLAQKVTRSFLSGLHASRATEMGLEFSEYRNYQPGDDLRFVDWKMFARSDRYFVRQSETSGRTALWLVIDCTASMSHEEEGVSKIDYARWLAASLSYLAAQQGDSVGLELLSSLGDTVVPAARGPQQWHRALVALERMRAGGEWPAPTGNGTNFDTTSQRQILVVITDLHQKRNEIMEFLHHRLLPEQEVVVFHLLGARELSFDYHGSCCFQDLETGQEIEVDAASVRQGYRAAHARWLTTAQSGFADRGIGYQQFTIDQPLDLALRSFLLSRLKSPCSI